ncbi:MAG: SDR family oxidoreductase [Bacteroidota bacterium]
MNIIVTGASSGIGYQTVMELAITNEHSIVVISRSKASLENLKAEVESTTKSKVHVINFDLGSNDFSKLFIEIDNCFQLSNGNFVDILINNAGYLVNKPFAELTMDDWQKSFDVNLFGSVKLIKILFPHFNRKETSHIVNISSMGGVQGTIKFPGLSAYSSSKASVNVLTESLAAEFENENIRTNALSLGAVQTEMLNKAFPDYKAPVTANQMGHYIADFALNGHKLMNGRIIQVSLSG